jgi:hypothetical protein
MRADPRPGVQRRTGAFSLQVAEQGNSHDNKLTPNGALPSASLEDIIKAQQV